MKNLLAGFLLVCSFAGCSNVEPPNVVTVILDDATKEHIELGMPHFMREIQSSATIYSSGVFDISLCGPSTANYLTGRIGRENGMTNCNPDEDLPPSSKGHGVSHNGIKGFSSGGVGSFDFRQTLLTEMKSAGYQVGWFGKYLNGFAGNSITSNIDGNHVRLSYKDVDKRTWKYAEDFNYQPVPPGVDTWRAEFDHTIEPGIFRYKIHVSDGESVGTEQEWAESPQFNPEKHLGEHITYFKHEVASFLSQNKDKKKFLTLRLFNPHVAQLIGELPYANSCSARQALPHASLRYRNTIDPMTITLPVSLTKFLETVSANTDNEPNDGKVLFPCGVEAGLSHQQMYEQTYRAATAATIEALHDYDDLLKEVIDTLKAQGEFENTLFVLFNDNGIMNGERGLFNKNKPWKESMALYLAVKYPGQTKQEIVSHHISNTYIAPTILDVAGVDSKIPLHAKSLRKITRDTKRQKILSEGYSRLCKKWEFEQVTDGQYNYFIKYFPDRPSEEFFFDVQEDAEELKNLIDNNKYQSEIAEFRKFLKEFAGGPMNTEKNIIEYRNNCN
jgi:arylsulfatase A-like enzyme